MTNDLVHGLLEVGDEALWIWSHERSRNGFGAAEGASLRGRALPKTRLHVSPGSGRGFFVRR
jgi:hypothetical protein